MVTNQTAIELTSFCNLSCPLCPVARDANTLSREHKTISEDSLRRIVELTKDITRTFHDTRFRDSRERIAHHAWSCGPFCSPIEALLLADFEEFTFVRHVIAQPFGARHKPIKCRFFHFARFDVLFVHDDRGQERPAS